MPDLGLSEEVIESIRAVLSRYSSVTRASVFGLRAKGTHKSYSDVDIVLYGQADLWTVEEIRNELEELPFPYSFDVLGYERIENQELKDHVDRVAVGIFKK